MQGQRFPFAKKVARVVRRRMARVKDKRTDASPALPNETVFGAIFAGNAETARKNLDRFAPRI